MTASDAACASSLIAIHLARQAIESGESTIAICGGVNVICAPGLTYMLQKAGALTTEGVCRSFDDDACGYARGEGGAVVVLKRLSTAIDDDDDILAILKSSASAQDGKTNGIMAPNSKAQELVARQALIRAGNISPHTIDYVEAHATSTSLGDPTEIIAIARVYGSNRAGHSSCYIGSIKPDVGHLEAASGAIGFVEAVLSLRKGILVPQTLLQELNTKIDWEASGLEILRDQKPWLKRDVRRAAVCCYGYGGSVYHAILEQEPTPLTSNVETRNKLVVTLTLSAAQEKRLHSHAMSLAHWLSAEGASEDMDAIARTLSQRRAVHSNAITSLTGFAKGRPTQWTTSSRILDRAVQKGVMGKELLHMPAFCHSLVTLDETFKHEMGFSVREALMHGDLGGSAQIQVLTYAVQISLSNLLKSQGILLQAIIGHSVGEIAAAVVAGCITEYEGAIIVARRAKLYEQVQGQGAMALELGKMSNIVAAIPSSPTSCVISGAIGAVEEYSCKVQTNIAFHSPEVECLPHPAVVPIYSTSASNPRTTALRDIDYWTTSMVDPVLLVDVVEAAADDGYRVFMEISSHPIISHSISDTLTTRAVDEFAAIPKAVSQLYALGVNFDIGASLGPGPWSTKVPKTPWVHRPYWKDISMGSAVTARQHDVDKHTLLGAPIEIADSQTTACITTLDDTTKPYPLTHLLDGTEIIPAAVYCNTFEKATGANILLNLELRVPTPMTADKREVHVVVQGDTIEMPSRLMKPEAAGDYLQKIGVSGIAYPWSVLEHFGNDQEMLVEMNMDPSSSAVSWDTASWAPFLDAATSVGSSIVFKNVRMRIVSGIDQVVFLSKIAPPKIIGMRFSDIEAVNENSTGLDSLVHRMTWVPPKLAETPLPMSNALMVSDESQTLDNYINILELMIRGQVVKALSILHKKDAVVFYLPGPVKKMEEVATKAHAFTCETASILSTLANMSSAPILFVITQSAHESSSPTALAHYALYGFARVAASEYPESWGGLIDNEGPAFPLLPVRYVKEHSVVRVQDGVPRGGVSNNTLLPKAHGTYVVTGGLGDLGLEVLEFLINNGARRIVVVLRCGLPPRKEWPSASGSMAAVVEKIDKLERLGATIYAIALDIGSESAGEDLAAALDRLSLPPVLGVVHAVGVSGYGYIKDTTADAYANVMASKAQGVMNLHTLFSPGSLDFFVLFSSIGQIIGTPGQSAYATSNAFLDGIATHRRVQGCNSIAMQWTAWRGLGLASDTALVDLELQSKGVTGITVEEGFQAWTHLSGIDTDHAVATRTRILDADEPFPCDLIADIVQSRAQLTSSAGSITSSTIVCLSRVLHLDVEEIDDRTAIADLGVDPGMTVALRQQLQKAMSITAPPTLTWSCPTPVHLVDWLYRKLEEKWWYMNLATGRGSGVEMLR
ncbi:hypothetical protein BKA63DRAFT_539149 [Paraphoma chrysanthemicola]|nr:hypothetical protein BKA63DRAFT_539149 [Paraphoma chrysanthemicola]